MGKLSEINFMGGKWATYDYDKHFLSAISPEPGCYVIYCDEQLVYVGQSTNVQKRIKSYDFGYTRYSNTGIHTPWGLCRKLVIKIRKSIRYGDWAMVELRLIKRLQPKLNCAGSVKAKGREFDRWGWVNEQ